MPEFKSALTQVTPTTSRHVSKKSRAMKASPPNEMEQLPPGPEEFRGNLLITTIT
jgi:hypothetical protein